MLADGGGEVLGTATFETVTTTMELRATTVVPAERRSFGSLQAQF